MIIFRSVIQMSLGIEQAYYEQNLIKIEDKILYLRSLLVISIFDWTSFDDVLIVEAVISEEQI